MLSVGISMCGRGDLNPRTPVRQNLLSPLGRILSPAPLARLSYSRECRILAIRLNSFWEDRLEFIQYPIQGRFALHLKVVLDPHNRLVDLPEDSRKVDGGS